MMTKKYHLVKNKNLQTRKAHQEQIVSRLHSLKQSFLRQTKRFHKLIQARCRLKVKILEVQKTINLSSKL